FGQVAGPARDRKPAEPDGEDQLQQQAGKEDRGGVAQDGEEAHKRIGEPVPLVGGDHAEGDAHGEGHDQRVDDQFQGGGAVLRQDLGHRAVVGEGGPEVPVQDVAQVVEVLEDDRPVIAGGVNPFGQLLRGQAPAQGGADGVAGDPHQEEDHADQDEDGGDDQQEPDDQVTGQAESRVLAFLFQNRGGPARFGVAYYSHVSLKSCALGPGSPALDGKRGGAARWRG